MNERALTRTHKINRSNKYSDSSVSPGGGYRGEMLSQRLKYSSEISYFFNLKKNRDSDIYLNLVESRRIEGDKNIFKRHSVLIFSEQREGFICECLAALEALAEGRVHQGTVESAQRQFGFYIHKASSGFSLTIREDSQHYDKPLQEQLQITQQCANSFSQILIEVTEEWLQLEQNAKKNFSAARAIKDSSEKDFRKVPKKIIKRKTTARKSTELEPFYTTSE